MPTKGQKPVLADIVGSMRCVIQRVSRASVAVGRRVTGEIGQGLLVLLGIRPQDGEVEIRRVAAKIARLRVFDDERGVMNRSVMDAGAEVLVVSQFTLYGDLRKGNRPSYNAAAPAEIAIPIYEQFVETLGTELGRHIPTGEFGEEMSVSLVNDGPVTIILDTDAL
jgi:D-tyrosyl-tRNA(Tyr) deacylase